MTVKPMKDLQELGQVVYQKRKSAMLTIKDLADRLGFSYTIIWNLEEAQPPPSLRKLKKVCDYLGIDFKEAKRLVLEYKMQKLKAKFQESPQ